MKTKNLLSGCLAVFVLSLSACSQPEPVSDTASAIYSETDNLLYESETETVASVSTYVFAVTDTSGRTVTDSKGGVVTAVESFPKEVFLFQRQLKFRRAADHIAILTALSHDLHKPSGMSERIEINGCRRFYSKFFLKIFLSHQNLSDKTFARRHITIGLEIPSAHDMPFLFFNQLFNSFEQIGCIHFYVSVCRRFIVAKDIIEFIRQLCRGTEGG